ncbi:TPA: lysozyme [Photobacterium damselae]
MAPPNRLTKPLLLAALALTGAFEGYRLVAYQDSGGIWTACYGETLGIKPKQVFDHETCEAMFSSSLQRHNRPLEAIPHALPPQVHLASLDLAYNIGIHAFQRSTLHRHLQDADYEAACQQFIRWRYVNGKDCRDRANQCYGIVIRRSLVQQLCLGEIDINHALASLGKMPLDVQVIEAMNDSQKNPNGH